MITEEIKEEPKPLVEAVMEIVLKTQEYLSPSSINTYWKCPRNYFYTYIAKLMTKPNIHLVKGTLVHKVLEDFFIKFNREHNMETHIMNLFATEWEKATKQIKMLELTPAEVLREKEDTRRIINEYIIMFKRKCDNYIFMGKAENLQHAYYLLKPKLREIYVKSEELKCRGYIDRVDKDFDGNITLADYKTSNKFGTGLVEDYKRQLAIYSLLYKDQEKVTPDFVAVVFLRFGEEYILEVTPSLLRYARDSITDTYAKTRSINIEDYPKKEGNLCRWCQFLPVCDGHEEWEKKYREQQLKKMLKKEAKAKEKLEAKENGTTKP